MLPGQWFGPAEGDREGFAVVDLDDGENSVRGTARVFFKDGSPGVICDLQIPKTADCHEIENAQLYWMPHGQASMANTAQIRAAYPDFAFPETASLKLKISSSSLSVEWKTSIESSGSATLTKDDPEGASGLPVEASTWTGFKEFALQHTPGSFIFRGQPEPRKLRTAFHRTYRKDLIRYVAEDIPLAHRQLTARTQHVFNMEKSLERGAFWNLLQHHGYPTPLLDWSYSPFVAAFFAYRRRQVGEAGVVRIYAFNKDMWKGDFNQLEAVNFAQPHFSILEALAIENPRAIPQQALSTLTNVDDIEAYIRMREAEKSKRYLYAIDLPAGLRPNVMAELSLMGITAGSLFPGLDGACEELMGRMFHHQVPPLQVK